MLHQNATAQPNGTLMSTTASHVGQVYFDQDLITQVEAVPAYAANTQALTTNAQDSILAEAAETTDPFVEYVLLGDSIEDGLLGWIAFGVNTTFTREVNAAVTLLETGGAPNANSGFPGGGPGGPPPSGFPGFRTSSQAASPTTAP